MYMRAALFNVQFITKIYITSTLYAQHKELPKCEIQNVRSRLGFYIFKK